LVMHRAASDGGKVGDHTLRTIEPIPGMVVVIQSLIAVCSAAVAVGFMRPFVRFGA